MNSPKFSQAFGWIVLVVSVAVGCFFLLRYLAGYNHAVAVAAEVDAHSVEVNVNEPGYRPSKMELSSSAPISDTANHTNSNAVERVSSETIAAAKTPMAATPAKAVVVNPKLTEVQARWLRLQQDCSKTPRTPARLQADLEYGLAATDAWSEAFQAALADTSQAVLLLMQSCDEFDQLPRPDIMPYVATGSNGIYTIAEIKLRADQTMRGFWMMPTTKGAAAYRDYRALQRLGVDLGPRVEGQLSRMRELVREEILAQYESESIVLATQIKK